MENLDIVSTIEIGVFIASIIGVAFITKHKTHQNTEEIKAINEKYERDKELTNKQRLEDINVLTSTLKKEIEAMNKRFYDENQENRSIFEKEISSLHTMLEKKDNVILELEKEKNRIIEALDRTYATKDYVREYYLSIKDHEKDINILSKDIEKGLERFEDAMTKFNHSTTSKINDILEIVTRTTPCKHIDSVGAKL